MEVNDSAQSWRPATPSDGDEEPTGTRRPKRVIHVEDDDDLRSICAEILRDAGFDVLGCANLSAAREAICASVPDVVLLDRDLPDGSGLDLARWLRSEPAFARLRIVGFSGRKSEEDIACAMRAGCDAFIGKPCVPGGLVETIESLVQRPEPEVARRRSGLRRRLQPVP